MNPAWLLSAWARAVLALPWLLVYSHGPSPSVLQAVAAGLAWLAFLALRMARPGWATQGSIADAWLLAGAISCGMALFQYFDAADGLQPWISASHGEAFANLRQRNQFASLCLIGLAAAWWRERTLDRLGWRLVLAGVAVLLLVGDAASQSRTGLVGLLVLAWLVACWPHPQRRHAWRLSLCALLVYALAAYALPLWSGHGQWGALSRITAEELPCQSRLTLWSNVLHLIALKPWTGWGLGELDYAHYMTLYPGPRFCAILDNAHNLPLHIAVELGVPAALLACGLTGWLVLRQRPWAERDEERQLAWMVLAVVGLHSLLEYPLWYGPFQLAVLLCVLLLWRTAPRAPALARPTSVLPAAALVTAAALAIAYVAWDYHRISQIYLAPAQRDADYAQDTLQKIRGSWLFRGQVQFAELSITPLTQANAAGQFELAQAMLHFSPEPRVVLRLIESAQMLHDEEVVALHLPRLKAAFPQAHADWLASFEPVKAPRSSPIFLRASPASEPP